MKNSLWIRSILIIALLFILWASNHYNWPYHNITGYVLIVCGVLVGLLGNRIDKR